MLDSLKTVHKKKLYGKWVWFMETCYSESKNLPKDWDINIMTANDDKPFMVYAEEKSKDVIGELVDAVMKEVAETSDQNVSEFGNNVLQRSSSF